nr:unnamed protein product [Spirometra erinaceieuropaei]
MEELLLRDPPNKCTAPLLSVDDSTLLTEETNSTTMGRALPRRPQPPLHHIRRCHRLFVAMWRPTWTSTSRPLSRKQSGGVQKLSSGKASGSDAIPAEVCKQGGPKLMDPLTASFQAMWRQGAVLQDFKDATIVHLSHRDWRTSIWSTNLHPPHPPPLSTLRSHIHAPHVPIRPHAHPRKPAVDDRRLHHTITSPLPFISPHINTATI